MKFLCDRCKTRYSIGDDRVRGKILKIRCKNCANVITVREGMADADALVPSTNGDSAVAGMPRRGRTTTQAPMPVVSSQAQPQSDVGEAVTVPANGRNAAHIAASKPPPALEEEWYVSIDGDQAGPFSLAEAQRWVAGRAYDAELHCWSEGFDDWLVVDKVSHFRGLRKKPVAAPPPAAPPPVPRMGTGPARAMAARAESEPKPLFAATMASLEKSAAAAAAAPGLGRDQGLNLPASRPSATPPKGLPSYSNGNGSHSSPVQAKATTNTPVPALKPNAPALTMRGVAPALPAARPATSPGLGNKLFDASERPFDDEAQTTAEPAASVARTAAIAERRANAFADELPKPATPMQAYKLPPPPEPEPDDNDNDDIDIGEVSRVVNLADLVRSAPRNNAAKRTGAVAPVHNATGSNPVLQRTGAVPLNRTGSVARLNATGGVPLLDGSEVAPPPAELAPAVPTVSHRRGMMALLIGAVVLLGAAVAVVFLVLNNNEDPTGLGGQYELNNERPDQVTRRPGDPPAGSGEAPVNPFVPKKLPPKIIPVQPKQPDPPPGGNSLKAEEIEQMAGKNSGTTQRCWIRSQRGVDGIALADVKKISVTLVIGPDGTVTDVQLSDNHANDNLGKCLIGSIRGWKFRTSPGGTFRFSLHFG
ncbi:MAG: GYF domain-containing protein [Kofleriaceae bacterium]